MVLLTPLYVFGVFALIAFLAGNINTIMCFDYFTEDLILEIQLLLLIALLTSSNISAIKKLWIFFSLVLILGILLCISDCGLFAGFFWLMELSFIIVYLLLVFSFNIVNKLAKPSIIGLIRSNSMLLFILPFYIAIIYYSYFSESPVSSVLLDVGFYDFSRKNTLTGFYVDTLSIGSTLSDIIGLGLYLFDSLGVILIIFALVLTLASIIIVIIQTHSSKYNLNFKKLWSKKLIRSVRSRIRKGFINREDLELQILTQPYLRRLGFSAL